MKSKRRVLSAAVVVLLALGVCEAVARPANISEETIQKLEEDLNSTYDIESTLSRRMATKRVVRRALSVVEEHAHAPNRFKLLGLIFQGQKELLVLKRNIEHRDALLETSKQLLKAPYDYAVERLEADVLLMQLEFEKEGATEHERAMGIAEMADRYRGTPAEVDSLMMGAELAFNLGEEDLLRAFRGALASRFKQDPKAIGFLKDRFASKSTSLMFKGHFKRDDGETIVFPIDRAGHVYLACFWSEKLNDLKERLMPIRDLQKKHPDKFEVYSFNLDELPDAGKGRLRTLGLDWTPMYLPGGSNNELFRACSSDPQFLIRIINTHGYMILTPIDPKPNRFGRRFGLEEYLGLTLDKEPFLSMIQSLRIGDFLVSNPFGKQTDSDIPDVLRACFVAPPMRYRLTTEQAMKNYVKADKLCADLLKQRSGNGHASILNVRIIALLGQWNLSGEPEYLREAVKLAKEILAGECPRDSQIVARFCLAKEALRQEKVDGDAVLADFIEHVGGANAQAPERFEQGAGKASPLAVGAAAVLSLDAGSPVLFQNYRERLLDEYLDQPQLWPLTALLFDRFMYRRFFRGNYHSTHERVYAGFRSWQKHTETRPRKFLVRFKDLNSNNVEFPCRNEDKTSVAVFMDLPADDTSAGVQAEFMKRLEGVSKAHLNGDLNYVAAFLSEDVDAVTALAQRNKWDSSRVVLVSGGERNPNVTRLGIFLADERPNTFVVAPDDTIMWGMSGMYQMSVGVGGVIGTVMDMIRQHDLLIARDALEANDFTKALRYFSGSFPPDRFHPAPNSYVQTTGRARAYEGLNRWEDALKEFDSIMTRHAKEAAQHPCACRSLSRKLEARAMILDKLGKDAESAAEHERASRLACPRDGEAKFHTDRYEHEIYNRLQSFIDKEDWEAALSYIDDVIKRGKDGRQGERQEFANVLREYAAVLEHAGQKDRAQNCRQWADALTAGILAPIVEEADDDEESYVDMVKD